MGPAAGPPEREVPLQGSVNSNGHLDTGWEREPHHNSKKSNCKKCTLVLTFVVLVLIVAVIVLAVLSGRSSAALGPACPHDWIGYQGKCYYFSEAEGNWNHSQTHCSSLGTSLAGIDTLQDLDFMLRCKGKFDHWIGLRRDPGQPWKWANGTEFNNLFLIGGRGDCAYLNDLGGASSLPCTSERHWICTKPSAFTEAKEAAAKGDS
ncbi:C-type lectin domain family 2 member D-like [Chrysemys picta bellii]|uniref:C-type lectin domain family 2 member D-like n=1 Tax=Chrysemys picta bellii TaxID=8478 RepID=UPI0032B28688